MEYIVITGVSTGIGYDAARYLIERGYYIFGSVRNQSDADRLKADFGDQFTPLIFDVTDIKGIKNAAGQSIKQLPAKRRKYDIHCQINGCQAGIYQDSFLPEQ